MKKILSKMGAVSVALACSIAIAAADPVVFNVDMSVQQAIGRFSPSSGDSVAVLGLNGDWTTGLEMSASVNPDVYTVTANLAAASWPNYKFVIKPAGGSWIWEDGNNRWFQVPAGGTNLPVVYFNNMTTVPSSPVRVTFQLNMQFAIQEGKFTPGFDYLNAFGSFDSWSTAGVLLTNVPGTSDYVGVLFSSTLATNTVVHYKYAINGYGGTWEGNVGPDGAQNRLFTLTSTNQVLPVDYWNNVTNIVPTSTVGFQVNMSALNALGLFTPGVDTVFVNGDWDWSGSAMQLFPAGNPDVYVGSVSMAVAPGATVNYKYTINGGLVWENDGVGPDGARNRQFVMNTNTNLPVDFFNNLRDLGPLWIARQGAQTTLTWPSGTNLNNRIRLQSAGSLAGGWVDVTGSEGESSVTRDFGLGPVFFRLTGP